MLTTALRFATNIGIDVPSTAPVPAPSDKTTEIPGEDTLGFSFESQKRRWSNVCKLKRCVRAAQLTLRAKITTI